jgi:Transposase IS116/IS110/IS902 family
LQAFPNLLHKASQTVLAAAPTPVLSARLTSKRVVALLHRCRRRNDPALVERILAAFKTPALRQPAAVEAALGVSAQTLLRVLAAQQAAVETLAKALSDRFDTHALAPILRSAPGLGPVLAARVLAEIGNDPARFDSPAGLRAFAGGTAPVHPRLRPLSLRQGPQDPQQATRRACHWWAFAMLTNPPAPERTTTVAEQPETTTAPPYAISPTSSSAASGGACKTKDSGTTMPPGPTPHPAQPQPPLDP